MGEPMGDIARAIATALAATLPGEPTELDKLRAITDPVDFARQVLGINPWRKQRQVLRAVVSNQRVAVCSGQKIGKTNLLAVVALYLYVQGWRVFVTTPTEQQLNGAFWRELRRLVSRALMPLPGARQIHTSARGGLHDQETFAHVVGLLGRDVEALQGMSDPKMAFIIDEAPGVVDELIEAIKGNLMGGGKLIMTGNPNRSSGEFFAAFKSRKQFYETFEVSSLETPNCTGDEPAIPGLATPEDCEQARREYGEDSPFYQVRVLGKFVIGEEGKCMPLTLIEQAHEAWKATAGEPFDTAYPLVIGIDPAGPSGEGDESVFAPRRGKRILELIARRGLNDDAHIVIARDLINKYSKPREAKSIIMLDCEGPIGAKLYYAMRAKLSDVAFVIGVRASHQAVRQRLVYERRRDEMHGAIAALARDGQLELPPDAKLDQELNAPSFYQTIKGLFKVTEKKQIKKELGRSPDRADAVLLAMWWIPSLEASEPTPKLEERDKPWADPYKTDNVYDGGLDPYG